MRLGGECALRSYCAVLAPPRAFGARCASAEPGQRRGQRANTHSTARLRQSVSLWCPPRPGNDQSLAIVGRIHQIRDASRHRFTEVFGQLCLLPGVSVLPEHSGLPGGRAGAGLQAALWGVAAALALVGWHWWGWRWRLR